MRTTYAFGETELKITLASLATLCALVLNYPGLGAHAQLATPPELPIIGFTEPRNVAEDTAYELFPQDFGYSLSFATPSFKVEALPANGVLLVNQQPVTESGLDLVVFSLIGEANSDVLWRLPGSRGNVTLEYVPNENFCGVDSLQWSRPSPQIELFNEDPSEAIPVQPQNTVNTKGLTVECINDAPVAEDFTVEFAQDTSWYFDMPDNADDNCFSARYSDVDTLTRGSFEAWELGGLYLASEPVHGKLFVYPEQTTQYGEAGEAYAWTRRRVIARDDIESMRYIPNAGYTGTDSFEWQATDYLFEESGLAVPPSNPTRERTGQASQYQYSNTATTTLNIFADTPPTVENIERQVRSGESYRFGARDFQDGYRDSEGNSVQYFRITSLPVDGVLLFNGSDEIPERLTPAELGQLEYIPNLGFSGVDSFEFVAVQEGNELTSANTGVVTIQVAEAEVEPETDVAPETEETPDEANPEVAGQPGGLIRTGGTKTNWSVRGAFFALSALLVTAYRRWLVK